MIPRVPSARIATPATNCRKASSRSARSDRASINTGSCAAMAVTCSAILSARSTTPRLSRRAPTCRDSATRAYSPSSRSRTSPRCCSIPPRRSISERTAVGVRADGCYIRAVNRREFLHVLASAAAAGFALDARAADAKRKSDAFYALPRFGNVHLLHLTDCHAQLLPGYFREPNINLGVGIAKGRVPHLVGEALLRRFGIKPGTGEAYAFTCLDFAHAARLYGRLGGFAQLATLIKRLKADRPGALVLDGGDTWQGSATALWTKGQDMVEAAKLLGVDVMTAHWEFTYGAERVEGLIAGELAGQIDFVAQNVRTADFGDAVFPAYALREVNGMPVAIIGQAFPYTPMAHPRSFVADWSFGIREQELQQIINEVRGKAAQVVVLLSHNGMDVDLKLGSRVTGIDAILGGHTHDGVPQPIVVANPGGKTLVTNAGCNGKFLGVLDFAARDGRVADFRCRLLPVFANL